MRTLQSKWGRPLPVSEVHYVVSLATCLKEWEGRESRPRAFMRNDAEENILANDFSAPTGRRSGLGQLSGGGP